MRPELDRGRLSRDVKGFLAARGLSYRQAAAAFVLLNPAMLSRAVNGQVLSVESFLALCGTVGLDPMAYLVAPGQDNGFRNQAVTAIVRRETAADAAARDRGRS